MCATQFGKINTLLEKARINLQAVMNPPAFYSSTQCHHHTLA
jgi:hypothetical protein